MPKKFAMGLFVLMKFAMGLFVLMKFAMGLFVLMFKSTETDMQLTLEPHLSWAGIMLKCYLYSFLYY